METFSISVIIPTYNSALTIKRAIDSVLQQTFLPQEIIIIDDCSHDNTLKIIKTIEPSIKLFVLKNDRNRGPGFSRNRGIEVSTGSWIAFLDADDYWHPQKLEIQTEILSSSGASLIGGIASIQEEQVSKYETTQIEQHKIIPKMMLWKNYFQTPTVLIKKTENLSFPPDMSYAEDFDLWSRMIKFHTMGISISPSLTYLGKKPFLNSGLSSQLLKMERGEIHVLSKEENPFLRIIAIGFSLLKFLRRVMIRITYQLF